MKLKTSCCSNLVAVLLNLLLAYGVYMLSRVVYVWENWELFRVGWSELSYSELLRGSLRFDSSAIFVTNSLYLILMLLPWHGKERKGYQGFCKGVFVTVNMLGVSANLADAVYSQFTGRRTTASFFREFGNEDNLGSIFFIELGRHWYLVLAGLLFLVLFILLYTRPCGEVPAGSRRGYYVVQSLCLLLAVPVTIVAQRGGVSTAIRPITISNANQYVNRPAEAAIVLNTPFSVIRTIGKSSFEVPNYFPENELQSFYNPLHQPAQPAMPPTVRRQKNVVVLIVESFGKEYIGFYNKSLENGQYKGYTPFMDSLLPHTLTFRHSFANGRKSIDGMPSILSSIPMFEEPFFLTPASLNRVSGMAGELRKAGYHTAFFHGAENGSMGFQAFARTTGFEEYYGRTEYNADPRFRGDKDFDGTWAIWDEPFLQYYALKMTEMQEPFATAVFTASSHHPFVVPEDYEEAFPAGNLPMHKPIGYADYALRRFFETASKQPWYCNTLFVITADHTNQSDHAEYKTGPGSFAVPIVFFDPSGELPVGFSNVVAQQIDIMPTVLDYVGYSSPYVAFGKNLLDSLAKPWAVNYLNGIYQYVQGDYLLLFDGSKETAFYHYVEDSLLKHNLQGTQPVIEQEMQRTLQALIQTYMHRMTTDSLTVR